MGRGLAEKVAVERDGMGWSAVEQDGMGWDAVKRNEQSEAEWDEA